MLAHTQRTGRSASRAATHAGNSAAAIVRLTPPGAAATIRPSLERPIAMRGASRQGSDMPPIYPRTAPVEPRTTSVGGTINRSGGLAPSMAST